MRHQFARRTTVVVFVLLGAACADRGAATVDDKSTLSVERLQLGDTTVVRNTGTNSSVEELTLVREFAIGKVAGSDHESFGSIRRIRATIDKAIVVSEFRPYRIQGFDSAGKLQRVFGGRGEGPGEFMLPMDFAIDPRGNLLHVDLKGNTYAVYGSDGKYLRNLHVKDSTGTKHSVFAVALDSNGILSAHTNMWDNPNRSPSLDPNLEAIVRMKPDGTILAIIPAPPRYGAEDVFVRYKTDHGTDRLDIPLMPRFQYWFVAPGFWATAHTSEYKILVHRDSGLLRIESDLVATSTAGAEKRDLAETANMQVPRLRTEPLVTASQIPAQKPYFKKISGDQSGRMWVSLHRPAQRTVEVGCPPSYQIGLSEGSGPGNCESDGKPPRPIASWVEPDVYDIFQPTGEFAGRLALPEKSTFMTALGSNVWLTVRDSLDVESVVRFRIVASTASPAAVFWR